MEEVKIVGFPFTSKRKEKVLPTVYHDIDADIIVQLITFLVEKG